MLGQIVEHIAVCLIQLITCWLRDGSTSDRRPVMAEHLARQATARWSTNA